MQTTREAKQLVAAKNAVGCAPFTVPMLCRLAMSGTKMYLASHARQPIVCCAGLRVKHQLLSNNASIRPNPALLRAAFLVLALLCLLPAISGPIALIGGFAFRNTLGHPFVQYNRKALSWLLKVAVIGLGFGISLPDAIQAGRSGFFLTISTILLVLIGGWLLGRLLKVDRKTSHLIASGTAICGGSAIAAVAPVIEASERHMSVSLGVVFLLNSVALLLFPVLGHWLELSQHDFGLWSAIAIHDTSSVVGAALAYGDEALQVATTVKLVRVLWIIPLALLSMLLFRGGKRKMKIPWFILLFAAAVAWTALAPLPAGVLSGIVTGSKSLLVVALFLVGAGLSIGELKVVGWKPMLLGAGLWAMVAVVSLCMILWL